MPKSKRAKEVIITKKPKTVKEFKKRKNLLVDKIREGVDEFGRIFVLNVKNQRNQELKELRDTLRDCKFVFGKNKVVGVALGKDQASELHLNLHLITERLHGDCALLFTNRPTNAIVEFFDEFKREGFCKVGNVSPATIKINAGYIVAKDDGTLVIVDKFDTFSSSDTPLISAVPLTLDQELRSLGLNTVIETGKIRLPSETVICRENQTLSDKQCVLLKKFGYKLSAFELKPVAIWEKNTKSFTSL